MTRKAVTKSQLARAIATIEDMGKTVHGITLHPDGSWHLALTPTPDEPVSSRKAQAVAAWDKALGIK